jgi:hypothetical protein
MSSMVEAKVELRDAIIDAARRGRLMSYTDAANAVTCTSVTPQSSTMRELLGAIVVEEHAKTGLLVTAVVVRHRDGVPGLGFFRAARKLGYDGTHNEFAFWAERRREVFDHFRAKSSQ